MLPPPPPQLFAQPGGNVAGLGGNPRFAVFVGQQPQQLAAVAAAMAKGVTSNLSQPPHRKSLIRNSVSLQQKAAVIFREERKPSGLCCTRRCRLSRAIPTSRCVCTLVDVIIVVVVVVWFDFCAPLGEPQRQWQRTLVRSFHVACA